MQNLRLLKITQLMLLLQTIQQHLLCFQEFKKQRKKGGAAGGGLDPQALLSMFTKQMGSMPGGGGVDPQAMQAAMSQLMSGGLGTMPSRGGGGGVRRNASSAQQRLRKKLEEKQGDGL